MKGCIFSALLVLVSFYSYANESYYAGHKRIFVNDDRFKLFPVAVWFPTTKTPKLENFGPFTLKVALGAKIAQGKFPLAIISHGSGGTLLGHRDTAQYLAKHGYIVAALQHPRNNHHDNVDEATTENWLNRPQHVSATLDEIFRDKELSTHINTDKIAVIGHSAGGYTALTLLGGIPDTKQIRLHCRHKRELDQGYCSLSRGKVAQHKDLKIEGLADKRFKSAVLLAPVGILFSDKGSLKKVRSPILMYRAESDSQLSYPFHAELIAKNLPEKNKLIYRVLKNANHFAFIAPFPKSIAEEVGLPAIDKLGFDRKQAHSKINADILNFLNKTLGSN